MKKKKKKMFLTTMLLNIEFVQIVSYSTFFKQVKREDFYLST